MHIRFNRTLRGDYGRAKPGDVKLVTKDVAKSLIARGLAVQVEAPGSGADDETLLAALAAQVEALRGKSVDEVSSAHSARELTAIFVHLNGDPAGLNKTKLAAAVANAIAQLPPSEPQ